MFNNIHLNPFSIPQLSTSVLLSFLGIFVIRKNPRSSINITFFLSCLSAIVWQFFDFLTYNFHNVGIINYLLRLSYCGVVFIILACFHYTIVFLKINWAKTWVKINYLYGLFLWILIFKTDYIIKGSKKYFWGYYPLAGDWHPYFLTYFFILVFFVYFLLMTTLIKAKESLSLEYRNQVKYVLFAFLIFNFASFDFIPNYGIEIYPFGFFPTILFMLIVTYAIVKHHLMDINIIFRKSFVYSILVALITAIYFVFVFLAEKLFQGMVGYTSLIVSIIYAFVIALFFNPAKNKIQHLADKIFLGKDPIQIARENELMKQELERSERLKAVAHFASGMAHEIKNPLTAIKTFTEYLPEKKNDPEFLNKFSSIVSGEVDRIDSLVHQLLDFAKPAPLKLEETDVNKLLDDTLNLLSNDFIKCKIKVNTDYTDKKLITQIDSNRMKQAFLNIFLNALEAMPSGGTFSIKTIVHRPQTIDESVDHRPSAMDSKVIIEVIDTGCGIPEKDLPRIFEPFYSTKENGTGLGLSIVYNIIKEHKGIVKVQSKIGEGTKFTIELPIEKV